MIEGEEDELEVAEPNKEEECKTADMDGVEVEGEGYEEVKDGKKREKPDHALPDSSNYVVTITERCNDYDPYLDALLDFTTHFLSLCLSASLSLALSIRYWPP